MKHSFLLAHVHYPTRKERAPRHSRRSGPYCCRQNIPFKSWEEKPHHRFHWPCQSIHWQLLGSKLGHASITQGLSVIYQVAVPKQALPFLWPSGFSSLVWECLMTYRISFLGFLGNHCIHSPRLINGLLWSGQSPSTGFTSSTNAL